jgi:hypothetical protein
MEIKKSPIFIAKKFIVTKFGVFFWDLEHPRVKWIFWKI